MGEVVINENDGAMSPSKRRNSKTPKLEDEEIYIAVDPDSDDVYEESAPNAVSCAANHTPTGCAYSIVKSQKMQ